MTWLDALAEKSLARLQVRVRRRGAGITRPANA
jgi:hypothetical protein